MRRGLPTYDSDIVTEFNFKLSRLNFNLKLKPSHLRVVSHWHSGCVCVSLMIQSPRGEKALELAQERLKWNSEPDSNIEADRDPECVALLQEAVTQSLATTVKTLPALLRCCKLGSWRHPERLGAGPAPRGCSRAPITARSRAVDCLTRNPRQRLRGRRWGRQTRRRGRVHNRREIRTLECFR